MFVTSEFTLSVTVSDSGDVHAFVSTAKVVIDAVSITPEIPSPDCVLTSGPKAEMLRTSKERDVKPLSSTAAEVTKPEFESNVWPG